MEHTGILCKNMKVRDNEGKSGEEFFTGEVGTEEDSGTMYM